LLVALPVVVAALAVLIGAAGNSRDLVLRTNGFAGQEVRLNLGQRACQLGLLPSGSFDGVRFGVAGPDGLPGPPLAVTVRRGPRVLARGRLARGYTLQQRREVALDRTVSGGRPVRVCFQNAGLRPAVLFGNPSGARGADLSFGRRKQVMALQLDLTGEPRSALGMVGTIMARASVLRPEWVGPWLFWLLGAAVLLGVPALLTAALRGIPPRGDDELSR
jgi:hypothetical protein